MTVALVLFTRDLRVHDNPVVHAAASSATQVVPTFVLDDDIEHTGYLSLNRSAFPAECLRVWMLR